MKISAANFKIKDHFNEEYNLQLMGTVIIQKQRTAVKMGYCSKIELSKALLDWTRFYFFRSNMTEKFYMIDIIT